MAATSPVLIIPGIGNSGPEHWQSRWQDREPDFLRVQQRDWDEPDFADWHANLEAAVAGCSEAPILVAHSLGCLLVAAWAARTALPVKAALLVAPPDPDGPGFPASARGFATLPRNALPFPSILVASRDDPYGDIVFAARCAALWGSRFVDGGYCGHINAESRLEDWPWGRELLGSLGA